MKKILTLLASMALSFSLVSAQNAYRTVGDKSVHVGLGFKSVHSGFSMGIPPLDAGFEYAVLDWGSAGTLSVGGMAAFSTETYQDYSFSNLFFGPQVVYRYPVMQNVDLFARLIAGYYSFTTSDDLMNDYLGAGGLEWAGYVGATYYFSEKMGVGLQFGTGISSAEVHLVIRL